MDTDICTQVYQTPYMRVYIRVHTRGSRWGSLVCVGGRQEPATGVPVYVGNFGAVFLVLHVNPERMSSTL